MTPQAVFRVRSVDQANADKIAVVLADPDNIRKTLPLLREAQQEDIGKAEACFVGPRICSVHKEEFAESIKKGGKLGCVTCYNEFTATIKRRETAPIWNLCGT